MKQKKKQKGKQKGKKQVVKYYNIQQVTPTLAREPKKTITLKELVALLVIGVATVVLSYCAIKGQPIEVTQSGTSLSVNAKK